MSPIATSAACCRRESSIGAYANAVARLELELVGAGGEPVDFWRTVNSHGLNDLVPNRIDSVERTLELTLYPGPQTVLVRKSGPTTVAVEGRAPRRVAGAVRHVLRLDEDLSPLYAKLAEDPALAWASHGAGRWMRSQTVFEDVVKTICTTNCAWSGTVRMVTALVEGSARSRTAGGARSRRPRGWRRRRSASTATSRARATAPRTSARSRAPWLPASSTSRRSPPTASSRTTRSRRGCSSCRASGRTRRRTS